MLSAQACAYSPIASREYSAPPADVPWRYFAVEFAADGKQAYAAFNVDGAEQAETIRMFVSADGSNWTAQIRRPDSQPPPPFNGQNVPIEAISPWNDGFRIAYDRRSLRSSSDGGRHWKDVGQLSSLMSVVQLKGEREGLESLARRGLAPTGRDTTWRTLIVARIVFDPLRAGRVYLLTNKGMYKSDNYGQCWTLLQVGTDMLFEVQSFTLNPTNPDRLLVGTTGGVFYSSDGGRHFARVLHEPAVLNR